MKRLYVLFLLVAALACGGGGSDPAEPEPDPTPSLTVVSGTFDVTATMTTDGCEQSTVWDGVYDVVIDSLSFSIGPTDGSWAYDGTWNESKDTAIAESEKDITITRGCKATRWTTFYVTFLTENKFRATVLYKTALGGDCGTRTGCTTSWNLVGTRQ